MRAFAAAILAWLAVTAPPAFAQRAPAAAGDIIVEGKLQQRSAWKRAESEHVIIVSDGRTAELVRVSRNLELLYQLLSHLYRRDGGPDETVKLHVTLFGSPKILGAIAPLQAATAEGPYAATFSDQTYYDPREDGEILAVPRRDQTGNLNTSLAANQDCDAVYEAGDDTGDGVICPPLPAFHEPSIRTWEELLYARFAQHFLLTYQPAAYPRWYVDGFGALFANLAIGSDGSIDYGRPPAQFRQVFKSFRALDVAAILTGRYLDAGDKSVWTPAHAWMLVHYFLLSPLPPRRASQFARYMAAIRQGTPMAEAAGVFGDMRSLQQEVVRQVDSDYLYAHARPPQVKIEAPLITALSPAAASRTEARLELGSPLRAQPEPGRPPMDAAWLAQARSAVEVYGDRDAWLFAAEVECRSYHPDACSADADHVLMTSPNDGEALTWKGIALLDRAVAAPATQRVEALAAARQTITRAIRIDGDAPLPLIAYFRSFTEAGEAAPQSAMLGMARVVRRIPAAPEPRLALARELVRQGKPDLARHLLSPVLYGPYDTPEKAAATRLFAAHAPALQAAS